MDKKEKRGFTLAELLIVVAIIAVLVAIAIPVFTARLEQSRETTDLANLRSAYAAGQVAAMNGIGSTKAGSLSGKTYYFNPNNSYGLASASTDGAKIGQGTKTDANINVDNVPDVIKSHWQGSVDVRDKVIKVLFDANGVKSVDFKVS